MSRRFVALLMLALTSQAVPAKEGDLYLFHNFYTNHLGDNSYYLRSKGEVAYEEDNNATGLRYGYSDQLSFWAGYTPHNSYEKESVFAAVEYAWPLGSYFELGAVGGVASGYGIVRNTVDGLALEFGPVIRVQKDRLAMSGVLINLDILVLNVEVNIWRF